MAIAPKLATTSIAIPAPLNEILVKLRFLGMIGPGKKLNTVAMSFTNKTSWWGAFKRFINGEDRIGLMTHINQVIDQAIQALTDYQHPTFRRLLINHLAQAKAGIQNLIATYKSDAYKTAELDVTIINIDLQLKEYKHLLHGHDGDLKKGPELTHGGTQVLQAVQSALSASSDILDEIVRGGATTVPEANDEK
jgi:hypothetical protein